MKWKGRPQSQNVIDETGAPPITLQPGEKMVDGTIWGGNKSKGQNTEFNPNDSKEMKVVKELGKKNREGTTPIPTQRPRITHDNLVTPGKWHTR